MNIKIWASTALTQPACFHFLVWHRHPRPRAQVRRGRRPCRVKSWPNNRIPGLTGEQARHYYFAEAGVESPYHLYVPKKYEGKTKLPLVVALHGAGARQNYFFRPAYGTPDLLKNTDSFWLHHSATTSLAHTAPCSRRGNLR